MPGYRRWHGSIVFLTVVTAGRRDLFSSQQARDWLRGAMEHTTADHPWEMLGLVLMPDHIHMCLSIPPQYSVAHTIGFLKGKSAVRIHRKLLQERRMTGLHFWASGYSVSTVGLDEQTISPFALER